MSTLPSGGSSSPRLHPVKGPATMPGSKGATGQGWNRLKARGKAMALRTAIVAIVLSFLGGGLVSAAISFALQKQLTPKPDFQVCPYYCPEKSPEQVADKLPAIQTDFGAPLLDYLVDETSSHKCYLDSQDAAYLASLPEGWNIHKNLFTGFKVAYPPDFIVEQRRDFPTTAITSGANPSFFMTITHGPDFYYHLPEDEDLACWVKAVFRRVHTGLPVTNTIVGGISGVQFFYPGIDGRMIYLTRNADIFELTMDYINDPQLQRIYEQILSTFRLLPKEQYKCSK